MEHNDFTKNHPSFPIASSKPPINLKIDFNTSISIAPLF